MLDDDECVWNHPRVLTDDDSKGLDRPDPALGRLRLAMVVRLFSPRGGLELYTHKLVEQLLERGHYVTVICQENQSDLKHDGLKVEFFPKPEPNLSKAERQRHYFEATTEAVLRCGPFDLVHSQHHPVRQADVVTFHNHTVSRLNLVGMRWEAALNTFKTSFAAAYRARDLYDRHLATTALCRIFTSKTCASDFYKTYKLEDAPFVVSYPGATIESAILDQAPPLQTGSQTNPDTTFNFLFVGKGFRKKGLDVLYESCALLKSEGYDFRLLIAGLSEKPLDKLRKLKFGLRNHVQYLGFRKDMENVYARARAIVLPSRIEPFGMAPLQGMLFGLVPIVSKVAGVSELLTDEYDALILKNHLDAEELAGHMARLIGDPELTENMSERARITAKKITWDNAVDRTISGYKIALQSRVREQSTECLNHSKN